MGKIWCAIRTTFKSGDGNKIQKAINHNHRVEWEECASADKECEQYNEYYVTPKNYDVITHMNNRLESLGYDPINNNGEKHLRKNGVRAFEGVVEFSSDSADQVPIEYWKAQVLEWIYMEFENKHPDKYGSNIISLTYHGDEEANLNEDGTQRGCGHFHFIIQPVNDKGKLTATPYLGDRSKFVSRQTSIWEHCGKEWGLERSDVYSIAPHQDKRVYNAKRSKRTLEGKEDVLEHDTLESFAERVNKNNEIRVVQQMKRERKLESERDSAIAQKNNAQHDLMLAQQQIELLRQDNNRLREMFEKAKKRVKQLKDKIIKLLPFASTFKSLMYAIENHPNQSSMEYVADEINRLSNWGNENREQDDIEKEFYVEDESQDHEFDIGKDD